MSDKQTVPERPAQGGSYIRRPDGSLERVAFTGPRPGRARKPAPERPEAGDAKQPRKKER